MKSAYLLLAMAFALLPGTAMASGFYLPWWGEVLFFLLFTAMGWACVALFVAALIVLVVFAAKRFCGWETQ